MVQKYFCPNCDGRGEVIDIVAHSAYKTKKCELCNGKQYIETSWEMYKSIYNSIHSIENIVYNANKYAYYHDDLYSY